MKTFLRKCLPPAVRRAWWFVSDRDWREQYLAIESRRRELKRAQKAAYAAIWEQTGGKVAAGPFAGLTYGNSVDLGLFPQKLLGTYEIELAECIETAVGKNYGSVIVIGAAEGYFACGLALRLADARVSAFEAQKTLHGTLERIAEANGLKDGIAIQGYCDEASLKALLVDGTRTLLVVDVEGFEHRLLDPTVIPQLQHADMLVEVHEHLSSGVTATLLERFGKSHVIERIKSRPRAMSDLPAAIQLEEKLALAAMEESRCETAEWFWMESRF